MNNINTTLNDIIKYETIFKSEIQFNYEILKIQNITLSKILNTNTTFKQQITMRYKLKNETINIK